MKKLLFFALAGLLALSSCSKDDPEPGVTLTGGETEQSVFADENTGAGEVEFKTAGAWTSTIAEGGATRAAAPAWITISPASGSAAGDYTVEINLDTNYTGADRTAVITITSNGKSLTITVTQQAETEEGDVPVEGVPVTGVSLDTSEMALFEGGDTEALTATVAPEDATNQEVVWSSSDETVATVDQTGKVTAVAAGTATITAVSSDNEAIKGECVVTVMAVPESVTIDGVEWATRNVDAPGTFVENPEDAGMFYQWNRRVGWSTTSPSTSSPAGMTWRPQFLDDINDPDYSAANADSWATANDPCPAGWRMPTEEEFEKLIAADRVWATRNGVKGVRFGVGVHSIFLPAGGEMSSPETVLFGDRGDGNYSFLFWSGSRRPNNHSPSGFWISYNGPLAANQQVNATISLWFPSSMGYSARCVKE